MKAITLLPLLASLMIAAPASAAMPQLGATLEQVKTSYPAADGVESQRGSPTLALHDVDYGGIHWSGVRFTFDAQRHLRSVTMTTRTLDYAGALALARQSSEETVEPGALLANADGGGGVELRICEEEDGQVSVTYEPATTPA